jgi:UPF0271 protein
MLKKLIDMNSDLGEECGNDLAMLDIVTTANVACGGHAGGGEIMLEVIAAAVSRGVKVGAHPSYPDKANFGRVSRFDELDKDQLLESLSSQIISVATALAKDGLVLSHVKPHGALYNDANIREEVADLICLAVADADSKMDYSNPTPIMTMPGTILASVARAQGHQVILEGFVDRLYTNDGLLTPRSTLGSVIHDSETASGQAINLAEGHVISAQGLRIQTPVTTLCIHSDSPSAVSIAKAASSALIAHDFVISSEANSLWL